MDLNTVLLKDGIVIMLIGMGGVFIFLTILVYVIDFCSYFLGILNKFFPEEVVAAGNSQKTQKTNSANAAIALAIAAAKRQR